MKKAVFIFALAAVALAYGTVFAGTDLLGSNDGNSVLFGLVTEWIMLLSISLTAILAIFVATQIGGFVGVGYRFIAAGLFFFGVLRDVFQFVGGESAAYLQQITELIGTLILLAGFFFIYRSIRKLVSG